MALAPAAWAAERNSTVDGRAMAGNGRAVWIATRKRMPMRCSSMWRLPGAIRTTACDDVVAILGFLDRDGAKPVEAAGKGRRELLGHVLDDDDGWRVGWQNLQHLAQGFRAAVEAPMQMIRVPISGHGLHLAGHGDDGVCGEFRLDIDRLGPGCTQLCLGRGLGDVADVHAGELQELHGADARLGDDVDPRLPRAPASGRWSHLPSGWSRSPPVSGAAP